jgi:hypothetical protein
VEDSNLPIVYDKKLFEQVQEKKQLIEDLKAVKKEILEEKHKESELAKYIGAIEMIDNYDLEEYRKLAMEKLDVIKQCLLLTQVGQGTEGTDESKS